MITRALSSLTSSWLFLLGFLLQSALIFGQAPEEKPARLRFLFLDETPGHYSIKLDSSFKRISAAPYTISPPYSPTGLRKLEIYKASQQVDPKTGRPTQTRVATFTPPSNTSSALVVVTPRPTQTTSDSAPTYSVEFIDDDASQFPGGSLRILNRGTASMTARLGGEQIVTQPGTTKIVTPSTDDRGRLRVLVAVQGTNQWRMIDDNLVIIKPGTRVTGILVYSPTGMKFRLGPYILAERGDPPPSHVWLTYTDTP